MVAAIATAKATELGFEAGLSVLELGFSKAVEAVSDRREQGRISDAFQTSRLWAWEILRGQPSLARCFGKFVDTATFQKQIGRIASQGPCSFDFDYKSLEEEILRNESRSGTPAGLDPEMRTSYTLFLSTLERQFYWNLQQGRPSPADSYIVSEINATRRDVEQARGDLDKVRRLSETTMLFLVLLALALPGGEALLHAFGAHTGLAVDGLIAVATAAVPSGLMQYIRSRSAAQTRPAPSRLPTPLTAAVSAQPPRLP